MSDYLRLLSFALSYGLGGNSYEFVTTASFALTIVFFALYLLCIGFGQLGMLTKKKVALLLLVFVCGEMAINTSGMVRGILNDWNYASRSLFTDPYPSVKQLVDQADKDNETFSVWKIWIPFLPMTVSTMVTAVSACFLQSATATPLVT